MIAGILTGRVKFRTALRGRIVLQVEYIWHGVGPGERPSPEALKIDRFDWRDATALDLSNPSLRWIVDGPAAANRSAA